MECLKGYQRSVEMMGLKLEMEGVVLNAGSRYVLQKKDKDWIELEEVVYYMSISESGYWYTLLDVLVVATEGLIK